MLCICMDTAAAPPHCIMIAKATLCELSAVEDRHCISIYGNITPDKYHKDDTGAFDTSLLNRLKSLVSEDQIVALEDFLNDLSLETHISSSRKWGFAIFATKGHLQYFHCPDIQNSLISVADAFDIKYLVPGMYVADHFHVIALDDNHVRLYRFDERVLTKGTECIQEISRNGKRIIDRSEGMSTATSPGPKYVDHSTADKRQIESMYRSFDTILYHSLKNDNCPILLAGTAADQALYRSITHLKHLHKAALPPVQDLSETRRIAEDTILECYREDLVQAIREFYFSSEINLISTDIEEILYLESVGRVKTLFVCNTAQLYGKYREGAQAVELMDREQPGLLDLVSLAVRRGLLFDAEVYVLPPEEMPSPIIAAVLNA